MKHKSAFLAGLSMFFCFCLISAGNALFESLGKAYFTLTTSLTQFVSFIIPSLFLLMFMGGKNGIKIPLSRRPLKPRNIRLGVYTGVFICLLSFLLNIFFLYISNQDVSGINPYAINSNDIIQNPIGYFMAFVIIPAVVNEIYVRGLIFGIFSKYADTKSSIIFSALVFAMLHSSLYNFMGYLVAGIIFAWLTYTFNSIWIAVISNAVSNIAYLVIIWVTDTYSAFGILKYMPYACFFLMLVFAYLSLSVTEKLLMVGRIPNFKKSFRTAKQAFFVLAINPASIIFILAFFAKNVFKII